ncbi:MAG: carboxypeptidase-like regulatory domain-containing protein [Acidobacteriota bacterium]
MIITLRNYIFALLLFLAAAGLAAAQTGVKGRVRANNGNPIPNATVTARQQGKDVKSVKTDSKGRFQLDGLAPGVYSFVFDADGFGSGLLQGIEVKSGSVRDLGERLILFPDRGLQVIVNGSVFYKEGTSLGGARVDIEELYSDGSAKKLTTVYTNISGEFTYKRPQGQARLRITARFKNAEASKIIDVDMAAIYRLALTLDISRTEK